MLLYGEQLELRCLPANYRWKETIASFTNDWNDSDNWQIERPVLGWVAATPLDYPGKGGRTDDDVYVNVSNQKDCIVNVDVTIHSLTIQFYTGAIILKNSITVSGVTIKDGREQSNSVFNFDSGATIAGYIDGAGNLTRGTLTLAKDAVGLWTEGTFEYVSVDIQRDQGTVASLSAQQGGNPTNRREMLSTTFQVSGRLGWHSGDVFVGRSAPGRPICEINIRSGGTFSVRGAGNTWGLPAGAAMPNPRLLSIVNDSGGQVVINSAGPTSPASAQFVADYRTAGTTAIQGGTLVIGGKAEQVGANAVFRLTNWSAIQTPLLGIRDGSMVGDGIVQGSLAVGYPNAADPPTIPVIMPEGIPGRGGTIRVEPFGGAGGFFHLYSGELRIRVLGPDVLQYGRLDITGNASISGPEGRVRRAVGLITPIAPIPAGTFINFMTYTSAVNLEAFTEFVIPPPANQNDWSNDKDSTHYWLMPLGAIPVPPAKKLGGLLQDNAGALANVGVRLFDADGATQLASTTSGADGKYEFDGLDPGVYVVQFDRPDGERFVQPDDTDAPDPLTGRETVALYDDLLNVNANYYEDMAPIAVDDGYKAHKNTPVSGNVLLNDTDSDLDDLAAALVSAPSHGSAVLNSDGSFTYTPDADWTGTDTFTYSADDGYEGTDTATVTITVAGTPAPVGADDGYTVPGGTLDVAAAAGVLANDTDQGNGTLTAVLATGPEHGTLSLNTDGSFGYAPDGDFVGTDTFTYYPTDADGPGSLATVSLSVTDHPPAAAADTASLAF
jgi:VCBS repeat-containing protein